MTDEDDAQYALAIAGRWSARSPRWPEFTGYGPTQEHARSDLLTRRLATPTNRPPVNVLTLIHDRDGRWTARASENLAVAGVGASEHDATGDLLVKLSPDPRRRWAPDRFTRTVTFAHLANGQWSAESDSGHRAIGRGRDRNNAEVELIAAEAKAEADNYDMNGDYSDDGYHKEDNSI